MRVLKFCLTSPINGEKGDGKLVMGRIRGLKENEVTVDIAYFRVVLRGKASVRLFRDHRVSGMIIELQVPLAKVVCGLWTSRKELLHTPIQTWLSYGYAASSYTMITRVLQSYNVVHFYHIRSAGLVCLARIQSLVILDLIDSYTLNLRSRNKERRLGMLMRYEYMQILRAEKNIDMFAPESRNNVAYLTVSHKDNAEVDTRIGRKFVVPVGTSIEGDMPTDKTLDKGKRAVSAVFFGNMNYGPNKNAALRLAGYKRELEQMKNAQYKIDITVAGRHAGGLLSYRLVRSGIDVVSPVKDMKELVCSHDIVILPMHSGSGMQSKLLEAIAWNKLVFASELAAEPLGLVEEKEYIRIESASDLDRKLRALASGELRVSEITRRASERLKGYSWNKTGELLRDIYTRGEEGVW